jgi:Ni/Fe-hydrogenase subunit HybB-like protein
MQHNPTAGVILPDTRIAGRPGFRIGFWGWVFVVILAAGAYATYVRFFQGLGPSTHLSDKFPWGLWIGFDILCGVGLAAGGFTMAATVHLFRIEKMKTVVRPAILTAFLGYVLVVFALMFDLGQPWRIWHPLIMWNPHSVMFEVGWCVTLYTTVLALEFSPIVFERLRWHRALSLVRRIMLPLVVFGVVLSTLHQSSLGSLYLIVPEKLYPLWYSPYLPLLFYLSALSVGCAMVIFESFMSRRAFGHRLELPVLADLGRTALVLLTVYALFRFLDMRDRHALAYVSWATVEGRMFLLEVALGTLLPILVLAVPKWRETEKGLFLGSLLIVLGFVLNRLNVSLTGMERGLGARYFPSWMEIAVTMAVVAVGFALFRLAVKHLPIFHEHRGA